MSAGSLPFEPHVRLRIEEEPHHVETPCGDATQFDVMWRGVAPLVSWTFTAALILPSFLSFSRRSLTASKRPKFDAMRRGVAPLVSILFDAIEEGGACTVHAPG